MRPYLEYIEKLQERGFKSASVHVYLAPIQKAFKLAMRQEYVLRNPVALAEKLRIQHRGKSSLDISQVKTILDAAKGSLKTFLYIAFYGGMRVGKILALTWDSFDFEKKARAVPMLSILKTNLLNPETVLPTSLKNAQCRKLYRQLLAGLVLFFPV